MLNIAKALAPQSKPGDILAMRLIVEADPQVQILGLKFSAIEIETLWLAFSGDLCAGFLILNDETLIQFQQWLSE
jgi:hypothetical protein